MKKLKSVLRVLIWFLIIAIVGTVEIGLIALYKSAEIISLESILIKNLPNFFFFTISWILAILSIVAFYRRYLSNKREDALDLLLVTSVAGFAGQSLYLFLGDISGTGHSTGFWGNLILSQLNVYLLIFLFPSEFK